MCGLSLDPHFIMNKYALQEHQKEPRGNTFSELLFRKWTLDKDQEKWEKEAQKMKKKDQFSTEANSQE